MIVALVTDFGERDGFVGAMKGAALAVNPDVRFVDVSHEVAPQAVIEGALVLRSVFDVFPLGTLFVAVVDPGVGGGRRVLAADIDGRFVLAPDNGLIAPLLAAGRRTEIRSVVASRFFREPAHPTFHGRDIFAPVAAHLSLGVPLSDLGPIAGAPVPLEIPKPRAEPGGLVGEVLHVDRFGNLVTNVEERDLAPFGDAPLAFEIAGRSAISRARTYVEAASLAEGTPSIAAAEGVPLVAAVVGSWGYIEIAIPGGRAADALGVGVGALLCVRRIESS